MFRVNTLNLSMVYNEVILLSRQTSDPPHPQPTRGENPRPPLGSLVILLTTEAVFF